MEEETGAEAVAMATAEEDVAVEVRRPAAAVEEEEEEEEEETSCGRQVIKPKVEENGALRKRISTYVGMHIGLFRTWACWRKSGELSSPPPFPIFIFHISN